MSGVDVNVTTIDNSGTAPNAQSTNQQVTPVGGTITSTIPGQDGGSVTTVVPYAASIEEGDTSQNPGYLERLSNFGSNSIASLRDTAGIVWNRTTQAWEDGVNGIQRENFDNMDEDVRNRLSLQSAVPPSLLSYPMGAFDDSISNSDTQLVHSVVFNILARSNSRVAQIRQNQGLTAAFDSSDENRTNGENAQQYLASLGTVAGAAFAYKRLKDLNNTARQIQGNPLGLVGQLAQGALIAGATGAVSSLAAENNSVVDIMTAIELYVTQPPIAEYEAMWEQKELGALGGMLARGERANLSVESFMSGASGLGEVGVRGVIGAAASLPGALGISGDLAAGIEATSKKVTNPYKEQLFKSMGFRKFAFSHKFAPRNLPELRNVLNIIQQFKYHMHPENDHSNLFLEYPSEFHIEYRYKGKRNKFVSRISTCALTGMKVTYGGQDAFTSFIDTEGAPSEFQLDLVFEELETLTNDRIGLDYEDSL